MLHYPNGTLVEDEVDPMSLLEGNSYENPLIVGTKYQIPDNVAVKSSAAPSVLTYDRNKTLFRLDTEYLVDTGLLPNELVLYCREAFHDLFKFIDNTAMNDKRNIGWIMGSTGVGRSTTALAFASVLGRNVWTRY